jgi:hypothetical protein
MGLIMKYTYGLYISGHLVDEIEINFEDIVVATAEFMEILGWEQRRGGQDYEIIAMTENTDEVDREELINELVDRLAEWDHEDLLKHVQENYRHELNIMDTLMLKEEHDDCFGEIKS